MTSSWTAVTRSALGFAALCAGLLHLAVGAPVWLAVGLAVVGRCRCSRRRCSGSH